MSSRSSSGWRLAGCARSRQRGSLSAPLRCRRLGGPTQTLEGVLDPPSEVILLCSGRRRGRWSGAKAASFLWSANDCLYLHRLARWPSGASHDGRPVLDECGAEVVDAGQGGAGETRCEGERSTPWRVDDGRRRKRNLVGQRSGRGVLAMQVGMTVSNCASLCHATPRHAYSRSLALHEGVYPDVGSVARFG